MDRSKFNVDKDREKRSCDGIVFDSQLEMRYYRDVLRPGVESGTIKKYELQKKYVLQPKFSRNGKTVLPITYVADFYIEYADGRVVVIDTKGCPDSVAKLKRKLFWYCFPDVDYRWITYVKKYGGWMDYEIVQSLRKEAKKKKNKREDHTDGERREESLDQCDGENDEGTLRENND